MNINQQSEIDELFNRINKNISKNPQSKISDEDLTRVRAFVVHSQRPLQAVRLLKKEREEREIDERFTQQKEDIISKAKQLDEEKKHFLERQRQVLASIASDKQQILKNQQKRKKEDERLKQLNQTAQEHQVTIQSLRGSIDKKKHKLDHRQSELQNLRKYTEFLEKVVANNKDVDENNNLGIEGLRGRFINLKNENKKLNNRKTAINERMEQVKEDERRALADMTAELYEKQRIMANLQGDIEGIQAQNNALEQDFENEIDRKNTNSKQVGQIVSSINNIYLTCHQLAQQQNNRNFPTFQEPTGEESHEMVVTLQKKVDAAVSTISELTDVLQYLNQDEYTLEKYYDDSAQQAADVANKRNNAAAGQSTYGGGAQSNYKGGAARSDNPNNSQITGTNATRSMRTKKI